jgi:hypothetical protein
MNRGRTLIVATFALSAALAYSQTAPQPDPTPAAPRAGIPDYPGVRTEVPGIWLPPVANAPFTAIVDIVSHEKLPDGTERIRTTTNHIARSSSGRIYNERRLLVTTAFQGLPPLLSAHTYDPGTRLSVVMESRTHLAKQTILAHPTPAIAGQSPIHINPNPGPGRTEEDLGTQNYQGYTLQGIRKTRAVAATASGTGQPITISDEYWFSPDLTVYFIIKHNDPRTGEQLVVISHVERAEPEASVFAIPSEFKIVDETPPPQPPPPGR